jgi:hypothetical protein
MTQDSDTPSEGISDYSVSIGGGGETEYSSAGADSSHAGAVGAQADDPVAVGGITQHAEATRQRYPAESIITFDRAHVRTPFEKLRPRRSRAATGRHGTAYASADRGVAEARKSVVWKGFTSSGAERLAQSAALSER